MLAVTPYPIVWERNQTQRNNYWPASRVLIVNSTPPRPLPSPTMLTLLLSPIIDIFRYSLQPIAPFTWFGLGISTLDVVATVRLCLVLRQIREQLHLEHVSTNGAKDVEQTSFIKNLTATLTVVYGGEAVTGA